MISRQNNNYTIKSSMFSSLILVNNNTLTFNSQEKKCVEFV